MVEQFASARHARAEFSRKLAGKKLFHQLVKNDTAARSGSDDLQMLNVALQRDDPIEKVAHPIGVVLAGPAPGDQWGTFLNGPLFGGKHVGRLLVRPGGRRRRFQTHKGRKIQFGNVVLAQIYRAEPGIL